MNKGIQRFYTEISRSYELVNSLMTLGLDYLWRKKAARAASDFCGIDCSCLDICSGTGQMAGNLARSTGEDARIVAADFSSHMLHEARKKLDGSEFKKISFVLSDALTLPFDNERFDVVTISFATRNLNAAPGHLLQAFREFKRVLRPGGVFINLETSQPSMSIIRVFFHWYVKLVVAPVGRLISGSKSSYIYLSRSIRRFHSAPVLSEILLEAGFSRVHYKKFLFGAVALHKAVN